jgi:hypothetical protein
MHVMMKSGLVLRSISVVKWIVASGTSLVLPASPPKASMRFYPQRVTVSCPKLCWLCHSASSPLDSHNTINSRRPLDLHFLLHILISLLHYSSPKKAVQISCSGSSPLPTHYTKQPQPAHTLPTNTRGNMSDDWDTVTKIGSKVRSGGGGGAAEKVIKGDAALNAARRQGAAISTEKKFSTANSSVRPACCPTSGHKEISQLANT